MEKGAIVRVAYDAYADGELFDTTSADTAKAHGVHREDAYYGPVPIVVGAGRVVPGLDKALLDAKPGEEREVEIPPEEGFGPRDPAKVETVGLREFQRRDVEPEPGMRVAWAGKGRGTIVSVTASRVRIDFNPPLAGKTLRYRFRVLEVLEAPEAKVRALLEADYALGQGDAFRVSVEGETAEVGLPDRCKLDPHWAATKYLLLADLRRYAGIKRVRFVEEYEAPEPLTEAEPQAAEPAAARAPPAKEVEEELTPEEREEVEREIAARKRES